MHTYIVVHAMYVCIISSSNSSIFVLQTDLKDPDMNVEEELLPWVKCHQDIARTLKKHEQKRQELIKGFNYVHTSQFKAMGL